MAASRPQSLRAIAACLGYALRQSRRHLQHLDETARGLDDARFLQPIRETLQDLGDTLGAYASMRHAPSDVAKQAALLARVATPPAAASVAERVRAPFSGMEDADCARCPR